MNTFEDIHTKPPPKKPTVRALDRSNTTLPTVKFGTGTKTTRQLLKISPQPTTSIYSLCVSLSLSLAMGNKSSFITQTDDTPPSSSSSSSSTATAVADSISDTKEPASPFPQRFVLPWHVITVAGRGVRSAGDGVGTSAGFRFCYDICSNRSRTFAYISDTFSADVRALNLQTGYVSTVVHIPGVRALSGIAVNPVDENQVFVFDHHGSRIFEVDVAGAVYKCVAGTDIGCVDGFGANARLFRPKRCTIDKNGEYLWFSDGSCVVRRMHLATHYVETVAGIPNPQNALLSEEHGTTVDGAFDEAKFGMCAAICLTSDMKKAYVSEFFGNCIRVLDFEKKVVSTLCGKPFVDGFIDGIGENAEFSGLRGMIMDQSERHLFVCDSKNNAVRRITIRSGEVCTLFSNSQQHHVQQSLDRMARTRASSDDNQHEEDGDDDSGHGDDDSDDLDEDEDDNDVTATATATAGTAQNAVNNYFEVDAKIDAKFDTPAGIAFATKDVLLIADAQNSMIRACVLPSISYESFVQGLATYRSVTRAPPDENVHCPIRDSFAYNKLFDYHVVNIIFDYI
jgi:hypothetical protein